MVTNGKRHKRGAKGKGIMSLTPFIGDFHKITLDFSEGINYLRNIRGNQPHGEQK